MRLLIDEALSHLLRQVVGPDATALPTTTWRWEVPKDPALGDLASPIAFRLASSRKQAPPQVAAQLVTSLQEALRGSPLQRMVERLEAKGGFVNAFLSPWALAQILTQINRQRRRYGTSRMGQGESILLEFVSANPTGPLSVAHGRQAAVGDALARVLQSQGFRVTTEYYLNDEGRQIDLLGQSLRARYLQQMGQQASIPEDGYPGEYLIEDAAACLTSIGERWLQAPLSTFIEQGMQRQLRRIQEDLARFGLVFERWQSQRTLRTSGQIDRALEAMKRRGVLYEQDGAAWFASTKFGDDKDRVVKKQSGELTYLAPDIAYHQEKFQRGYHRLINLWGPDHHGYIARLKAAVTALGLPADQLVIRIVQLVTLSRKGSPVPMSKRQGEFVTFREVLDEVGVDATRFFYLMRTMDSHLDFDVELAKSQSQENPVYYVQYAHARICSILAYAHTQLPWWQRLRAVDLSRLGAEEERLLLRELFQFPLVVASCARALEPHGLTSYLQRLAERFHVFYTKHRVVTEDVPRSLARLATVRATRQVLANGLGLVGVSAPRRM